LVLLGGNYLFWKDFSPEFSLPDEVDINMPAGWMAVGIE
jgi:hypothetical protein